MRSGMPSVSIRCPGPFGRSQASTGRDHGQGDRFVHHNVRRALLWYAHRSMGRIGFVVAAYNESAEAIDVAVSSLLAQTTGGSVVVADDGSQKSVTIDRHTVTLVRFDRNRGVSAARNAAIKYLDGEFVGVVNCDMEVPPGWAAHLVDYLDQHPNVGCAWTRMTHALPGRKADWWIDCIDWHGRDFSPGEVEFAPGHAALFRRRAFDCVGGYDARVRATEDYDISIRLQDAGWTSHLVEGEPSISHQSLTLAAMASKDRERMKLNGKGRLVQARMVSWKAVRRIGRHSLKCRFQFIGRDFLVGVIGIYKVMRT